MPAPRLRAVTFDLDGLILNTELLYERCGAELLRRRGKVFTKELLDRMMGRPGHISLQIMIDEHALPISALDLLAESDEVFKGIMEAELALMPGLLELLDLLEQRGLPKGIATSSRRNHADYALGRFNLLPRFDFILTAEDITHGKPDPEIYLKAAAKHGVDPGEMLVLEDSQNGCRAAVAAGAYAVAVPGPHNAGHNYDGAKFEAVTLADPRIRELLANSGVDERRRTS